MFVSNGTLVKTPVKAGSVSWFPSVPAMSGSQWSAHYAHTFRSQLWVYVVIMKRARALARLPIPVYARGEDGDRSKVRDHPMARLLASPNPAMSGFKLLEWTSATRDIFGRATWYKVREAGTVKQLWPLHPSGLSPNGDGTWNFANGTLRLDGIPAVDLMHFLSFSPDRIGEGMSPLEPLRATLENEFAARTATASFWQRGARPGFVVEHPGKISIPAYDRLKTSFAESHEGPGRVGSTLILEEGMKAAKMELTAEEAQYIETRKLNREEACAAYDVPPPVVHILDRATFSNITEQMRSMYRDTMAPIAAEFEGVIETELRVAEFGDQDVYAEFLMDDVMRGDFEARQSALAAATHMTIAEKRKVENLPFIPGTDRIFLNTATLPLDAIDAQADAIVAATSERQRQLSEGAAPAPEPKSLPMADYRTVLGRLGWQKDLAAVDVAGLTRGLSDSSAGFVAAAVLSSASIPDIKAALKAATKEGS